MLSYIHSKELSQGHSMSDRLYIPEFYSEDIAEDVTFERASFYFNHWGEGDDFLDKLIKFEKFYEYQKRYKF